MGQVTQGGVLVGVGSECQVVGVPITVCVISRRCQRFITVIVGTNVR